MAQKLAKMKMTPELTGLRLGICPPKCQRKLDEISSFVLLEIGHWLGFCRLSIKWQKRDEFIAKSAWWLNIFTIDKPPSWCNSWGWFCAIFGVFWLKI